MGHAYGVGRIPPRFSVSPPRFMACHSINFLLNDALLDPTGNTPQHQISSITEPGPTSVWDGRCQELKVGILMQLKLDLQTNVEYYSGAN